MRHFATLSTAVDSEVASACGTTTDPFSIMEKSDESQFFENMTIYLKTKKKLSQWTKQMRWRIKKSLPSFVSYVDVEPYAINRLCLSMRNVRDYYPPKDYHRVATTCTQTFTI